MLEFSRRHVAGLRSACVLGQLCCVRIPRSYAQSYNFRKLQRSLSGDQLSGKFWKGFSCLRKQLISDWSSLFKVSINQWYNRCPKKQILIITVPKAVAFEQALHSRESREVTREVARLRVLKQLGSLAVLLPELARRLRKLVPMLSEALYWRV